MNQTGRTANATAVGPAPRAGRTAPAPRHHALLPSPLGEILLTFDDAVLTGLYFVGQKDAPPIGADWIRDDGHPIAARVGTQLARYFAGAGVDFDVPLRLDGTAFQQRVWQALRGIPAGRTLCYGDIARLVGAQAAVRAVGAAIGRNPVSIIVPCHRVIGRNGTLTGYAGGLARKETLLRLEGVV
jgi:methylated-DNA-[protein]-cysteine S-methyltransferase